jgi:hypothetical protein
MITAVSKAPILGHLVCARNIWNRVRTDHAKRPSIAHFDSQIDFRYVCSAAVHVLNVLQNASSTVLGYEIAFVESLHSIKTSAGRR